MSIVFHKILETPQQVWNLARSSGPASVFYQPSLLDLWQDVFGWEGRVYSDGRSLLVGFIKKITLGRSFYSLPYGWYGGAIDELENTDFLAAIFELLRQERFMQENIVQFGSRWPSELESHYQRRDCRTQILDLTGQSYYSTNTRRNVDKAERNDLEWTAVTADTIAEYVRVVTEHVALTGKARILPLAFYRRLLELSLAPDSAVKVVGANRDGDLLAWQVYFTSVTDSFYFDGFSNQAGRDSLANFWLFDRMINDARDRGVQRLNFGASPEDDSGLLRFKEGWGAQPVTCYEYSRAKTLKRIIDRVRGHG